MKTTFPEFADRRILTLLALVLAGLVGLTSTPTAAAAQTTDVIAIADSLAETIRVASLQGDVAALRDARTLAGRALTAYPDHPLLTYYLAETYYREAGRLSEQDPEAMQDLLESASEILDRAVERPDAIAETHALHSSVLGMRITNMMNAVTLGRRADAAIERALEVEPDNPRVWLARAIGTLYKPGFLGGGADNALEQLDHAVELFVTDDPAPGHPTWGRAEVYVWIGMAHAEAERPAEARAAFEEALRIEPGFEWAKMLVSQAQAGAEAQVNARGRRQ